MKFIQGLWQTECIKALKYQQLQMYKSILIFWMKLSNKLLKGEHYSQNSSCGINCARRFEVRRNSAQMLLLVIIFSASKKIQLNHSF